MDKKKSIRIGGVPEHFNYIFTIAEEYNLYNEYDIKVKFVEKKCGTGEMIESLKKNEVDIIISLTEGLVKDIAQGSKIKIIGTYVESTLCWAVSTGINKEINNLDDLKGKKIGISRHGSGSHLMAHILGFEKNWKIDDLKFKVIGDFKKLRDSVNDISQENNTDAFLWEKFTTKPFHDSNEIKKIGEIETKWPCFMIASLEENISKNLEDYKKLLIVLNKASLIFKLYNKKMPLLISKKYKLNILDSNLWYKNVNINPRKFISRKSLEKVLEILLKMHLISENIINNIDNFIDKRISYFE